MSNKNNFITDLENWMQDGSSNMFSIPIQGLQELANKIKDYVNTAEDNFGNKFVDFTANEFVATVSSLTVGSTPATAASSFANGIVLSFIGKNLQIINLPPNGVSGISNIITTPPVYAPLYNAFLNIFTKDYNQEAQNAPNPNNPEPYLRNIIATDIANAIENAVVNTGHTFNYMMSAIPSPIPAVFIGVLTIN